MNFRERFLETMQNFNPDVTTVKWEFGYWGETINRWYKSGLPRKNPAKIPDKYTTPTASLYTKAWTCENKFVKEGEYPKGIAVTAGGLYTPTQGMPYDQDVRGYFNLDESQRVVNVNLLFYPMFEPKILEEDHAKLKYLDLDGVIRVFLKEEGTMPSGWKWPIEDRKSWYKLKEERMNFDNIRDRLPDNWSKMVEEYKNRDYPLALGGYPHGFFGTLANLMGYEKLFLAYYDDPELVHDILETFTNLWIAVFSEVLAEVEIDHMQIWEDISYGKGSMVSNKVIKEFMVPYYKRLTSFLKSEGVDLVFVDTDGYCMDIIPLFIEGGVNGMYPFEVHTGMDILEVRKKFPELAIMGGIPKSEIAKGKNRINQILEPVEKLIKMGGYIPFADHLVPPEVSWEDFKYYRNKLNDIIDNK